MFSSQSQALAHYKGTKHAKKLKALDAPKSKLKGSVVTKETTNQEIAKGINTLQVPNGTDRKGLCYTACCTFPDMCLLFIYVAAALLLEMNVGPNKGTFWHFRFAAHNMQSLQELDGLTVDYINPVLAGQRNGWLPTYILNY